MFKNRMREQLFMGLTPAMREGMNSGVRDQCGVTVPYQDDPLRNPAAAFMPQGYMATGYDTGRRY